LPPTRQIVIHGFITSRGQKMSKSLGNVIDPYAIVEEYGADALRLYLAKHIHPSEDSDFTMGKFKESYNADLANGLGNLAARILQLAEKNLDEAVTRPEPVGFPAEYTNALERFDYNAAAQYIWERIAALNLRLTNEKPFAVVKTEPEKGRAMIAECVLELYAIARLLQPIMPKTSDALKAAILANKKPENLFPRKE
jgi:methionyl-tRNA synthetase